MTAISTGSTFLDYRLVDRRMPEVREAVATRASEQRDIDYFIANIAKVTTGDELVEDTRLYRFAMTAFGLEDQIFAKGLMRKIFDEGVEDKLSQANRMTDNRYRDIAAAFGFAEVGGARTKDAGFVAEVINRFISQRVETDQVNDGVRLALYFERKSPRLDSWFDVLADPALREVARVGLGFPKQINAIDVDRFAEKLEERFDIADLQDPEKRADFLKKFAIRWDLEQASDPLAGPAAPALSGPGANVLSLLAPVGGSNFGFGIDANTLMAARR